MSLGLMSGFQSAGVKNAAGVPSIADAYSANTFGTARGAEVLRGCLYVERCTRGPTDSQSSILTLFIHRQKG